MVLPTMIIVSEFIVSKWDGIRKATLEIESCRSLLQKPQVEKIRSLGSSVDAPGTSENFQP